jgi:eukaryotic-like serine/threonine-protein kinase
MVPGVEWWCPTCERSFGPDTLRCPDDDSPLVRLGTREDALLGRVLDGRFELRHKIGAGGMGAVYAGWQRSVGREVAVKIIRADVAADPMSAKRFLREAKLSSRISHPNTVTLHEFGQTEDGLLYIVMELVRGRTLAEVLRRDQVLSTSRLIRIAVQLCDALEAAHNLGIVHRDLKPSNVLVLDEPRGRDHIKVLDFGLARSLLGEETTATLSGVLVGTPAYLPPEAAQNAPPTVRGDLYSLGVILYELASGHRPFSGANLHVLLTKHLEEAPPPLPPHVPMSVRGLVFSLLAKDPLHRPASAADVRAALFDVEISQEASITPPPILPRADTFSNAETVNLQPGLATATLTPEQVPSQPTLPIPKRPRWPLGVAALAVLAAVTFLVMPKPQPLSGWPSITLATPPPPRAPTPPPPPERAEPLHMVALLLTCEPRAEVVIDGVVAGRTPLSVSRLRDDKPLKVVFRRDGYRSAQRLVVPDRSRTESVRLERQKVLLP